MINLLEIIIIPVVISLFIIMKIIMGSGLVTGGRKTEDEKDLNEKAKSVNVFLIVMTIFAALLHILVFVELFNKFNSTSFVIIIGVLLSFPIYGSAMLIVGAFSLFKYISSNDKD